MTLEKHLWLSEQGISDICEQVPLLLSKQEDNVNDAKAKANILAKCNGHDGNVFQQLKTSVRIHNTQTFKISPMIVLF
jgi:hypothetical protein